MVTLRISRDGRDHVTTLPAWAWDEISYGWGWIRRLEEAVDRMDACVPKEEWPGGYGG